MRRAPVLVAACLLAAAATACGDDGKSSAQPTRTPTPSAPPKCTESELPPKGEWPIEVPEDLPKPRGAQIEKVERTQTGVVVVRFSTRNSLQEGVVHVVREFPKHGYTIGRGDVEMTEADAPFSKGNLHGLVRMLAREQCKTLWLLAVGGEGAGTGLYSPPASASALPFG